LAHLGSGQDLANGCQFDDKRCRPSQQAADQDRVVVRWLTSESQGNL
jgi:hypothetical protein